MVKVFAALLSLLAVLLATQSQDTTRADAGGASVRMVIAGTGAPAVIFDTGGGGALELWGSVPAQVSKFAKVASYDRAGNGLSDKATNPRDGRHIATELRTALRHANVPPPYVLVGHSLGGPHIRIFAGMYPDEVAGMVLVDPTQEEEFEEPLGGVCGVDDERGCIDTTLAQAHESAVPPVPVVLVHVMFNWPHGPFPTKALDEVLKVQTPRVPSRLKHHKEWVEKIPGGQLIITENSAHGTINFEEPELVVGAIRQVVEKARR